MMHWDFPEVCMVRRHRGWGLSACKYVEISLCLSDTAPPRPPQLHLVFWALGFNMKRNITLLCFKTGLESGAQAIACLSPSPSRHC